jgi:hypothetical protein
MQAEWHSSVYQPPLRRPHGSEANAEFRWHRFCPVAKPLFPVSAMRAGPSLCAAPQMLFRIY